MYFKPPPSMKNGIHRSIIKAKRNKYRGVDRVYHETLKVEPTIAAKIIYDIWKLIGKIKTYPTDLLHELLAPIYKKGAANEPENYRPVCMLSCIRETI